MLEHEQHRLERHAGKVVYEEPTEAELRHSHHEPKHPTLKPASAAMQRHAENLYYKVGYCTKKRFGDELVLF